ncbi:MAG: PEP-CTERM sorting domain-containing protein [Spirirestis rafaelensis WJT71-NPBG6]|nr:PEP-CTERM sorting domain-containing protein [Spirirestis rafaelensis WJT71-NPBG6]
MASIAVSFLAAAGVLSTTFAPAQAHGSDTDHDHTEFFIGLDGLNVLDRGTYAGLDNPNYNRLTLLFAHREEDPTTNHFHGIGAYSYSGTVDNPIINSTSTNNRIPETYTNQPPLTLLPGTGIYRDRLISGLTNDEYSNLKIEPIASLKNAPEPEDQYLYNSSNGRWQPSLEGATIGLQLASISNGLNIVNSGGVDILKSVGDIYTIGTSDSFSFTPTFWTDAAAPLGTYSATFKLVDLGSDNNRTAFKESGTFSFDFQVKKVPEPSAIFGLGIIGLLTVSLSQLKKRTSTSLN